MLPKDRTDRYLMEGKTYKVTESDISNLVEALHKYTGWSMYELGKIVERELHIPPEEDDVSDDPIYPEGSLQDRFPDRFRRDGTIKGGDY